MVNYHNHTSLCRHATGTTEDYIRAAIKSGAREIGFSDHAPIPLPYRQGITMEPDETEAYIKEIVNFSAAYEGIIDVRVGFEVDFPLFGTFDKRYFTDERIDFIMGSCHFIGTWAFDHPDLIDEFNRRDINEVYGQYYTLIEELVRSRLFDIVGHFDLIKKFGHRATKDFNPFIERIASLMADYDTAAEINTAGLVKPVHEAYPSDDIIKIFFSKNVPVTLGSDSHSPEQVGYMLPETMEKLKKIGYRKVSGFKKRKRYDITI